MNSILYKKSNEKYKKINKKIKKSKNNIPNIFIKNINLFKNNKENFNKKIKIIDNTRHYPPATREWSNSIYNFNKKLIRFLPVADNTVFEIIDGYFYLHNVKLEKNASIKSFFKIFISKGELKHTNDEIIITFNIFNNKVYKKNNIIRLREQIKLSIKELKKIKIKKNKYLFSYFKRIFFYEINKKYLLYYKILLSHYKYIYILDKYKFNNIFINKLSNLIYKIYNKNIKLNFINLKYNYMNIDILTQYIIKQSNYNNQNVILKDILRKIRMPFVNKLHKGYRLPNTNNINTLDTIKIKDSNFKILKNNKVNNKIKSSILKFIKYKWVNGIRLELLGRLSRRFIAQRSVFKYKYVGSIKNIDSSYKQLSTVILKNNINSNIQYSKINSKTRIGAYGLKGWISGT